MSFFFGLFSLLCGDESCNKIFCWFAIVKIGFEWIIHWVDACLLALQQKQVFKFIFFLFEKCFKAIHFAFFLSQTWKHELVKKKEKDDKIQKEVITIHGGCKMLGKLKNCLLLLNFTMFAFQLSRKKNSDFCVTYVRTTTS